MARPPAKIVAGRPQNARQRAGAGVTPATRPWAHQGPLRCVPQCVTVGPFLFVIGAHTVLEAGLRLQLSRSSSRKALFRGYCVRSRSVSSRASSERPAFAIRRRLCAMA